MRPKKQVKDPQEKVLRFKLKQRAMALLVPCGVTMGLAGCGGPLSTLAPQGPVAAQIAVLWWAMLAGAAAISLLVLGLIWRGFRRGETPDSPANLQAAERFWIKGMGLGFSLCILIAVVAGSIVVGERIQARPGPDVVEVRAIAKQWQWRFVQTSPEGRSIETRNRLYIPAGTPVDVRIESEDVIHAFWVPQLAGKMDAIPGRSNVLRLKADRPGVYQGRSAEFSGLGYTGMTFELWAYDPADPPPFDDALDATAAGEAP